MVTPNTTGDPVLDADTVSIMNVFSTTNFSVGSENFTLELLGFSDDNGTTIDNTFTLPEDATTTSQLIGNITTAPDPTTPVPESESSTAILILGLGMIAGWQYRNQILR